jgi:hypothetical protein
MDFDQQAGRLISKMCRSLEFGKRETNFTEKLIFRGLENFAKSIFMRKNLWALWELGRETVKYFKKCFFIN